MNQNWDFPALCFAVAFAIVGCAWAPNNGMNYYERVSYESYLEVCSDQGIMPEPPKIQCFSHKDLEEFDIKQNSESKR